MQSTKEITKCQLGKGGPQLPRIGIGLMGHNKIYGIPGSDEERLAFLDGAYARSELFWDTGEIFWRIQGLLRTEYS